MDPEQQTERTFDHRGGVIGRGEECDWVLSCPQMLISRRHCVVTYEKSRYCLYDASTNGVFVNGSDEPLGQGGRAVLADGDVLSMGSLTVHTRITDELPEGDGGRHAARSGEGAVEEVADIAAADTPAPGNAEHVHDPAPRHSVRVGVDLGNTADCFTAPAVIPQDWNFCDDPLKRREASSGPPSVSERLNALEPEAARLVRKQLGMSAHGESAEDIPPAAIADLARCARRSIGTLYDARADLDSVERRFTGSDNVNGSGQHAPESLLKRYGTPGAFLRRLVEESDATVREGLLRDLEVEASYVRDAQHGLAAALWNTSRRLVRYCDPVRVTAEALRGRSGLTAPRRAIRWLCLRANPAGTRWRIYRRWHDGVAAGGEAETRRWFENAVRRFILRQRRRVVRAR